MNYYEKYLPIGTVVMLKEGTKRVMITGFCVTADKQEGVYDYSGCMYPEGILSSEKNCLFNHQQIDKIYHLGLVDNEEKEFKQKLSALLKNDDNL